MPSWSAWCPALRAAGLLDIDATGTDDAMRLAGQAKSFDGKKG